MEECCLLACLLWLAQPDFFQNTGSFKVSDTATVSPALPDQLSKTFPEKIR